jgi:hypothetical protein
MVGRRPSRAVSSAEGDAEPTRHRLDLLGNRTINSVLYVMSVTQSRYHQPPRNYLERNGLKATARKKPAVPTRLCRADASSDACGPTDADNLIIQHPKLPNRIPLDKGAAGTPLGPTLAVQAAASVSSTA